MDVTHTIIQNLLAEMENSLRQSVTGPSVGADWATWERNVSKLQSNLAIQLERCRGKFSGDLESVGAMASRSHIVDSLHQLEKAIDSNLIYYLRL